MVGKGLRFPPFRKRDATHYGSEPSSSSLVPAHISLNWFKYLSKSILYFLNLHLLKLPHPRDTAKSHIRKCLRPRDPFSQNSGACSPSETLWVPNFSLVIKDHIKLTCNRTAFLPVTQARIPCLTRPSPWQTKKTPGSYHQPSRSLFWNKRWTPWNESLKWREK